MSDIDMTKVQGSPEWLEFRKDKIGGSDAGTVLGLSPYMTALQLYEEKKGLREPQEQNFFMQRGVELEPVARELYEKETGNFMQPAVEVSVEHPFMMASLDGMSFDGGLILEIKCGSGAFKQAKDGIIPDHYMAQLQHNMYVTGCRECHFYCLNPDSVKIQDQVEMLFGEDNVKPSYETVLIKVERDEKFIELMIEAEKEFNQCMVSNIPPEATGKDITIVAEDELGHHICDVIDEIKKCMPEYRLMEKRLTELKKQLVTYASNRSIRCRGIEIKKNLRKGSIDYGKIIDKELPDLNIEEFRKKPTVSWAVTILYHGQ